MKVTTASESEPEVLSAFRWMERAELSFSSLASSKTSGESDSVHSTELGSSHIQDQISMVFGCGVYGESLGYVKRVNGVLRSERMITELPTWKQFEPRRDEELVVVRVA